MRIERHIFGSYSGYMTLARSAGLTTDDCRLLEAGAYNFGQSNERSFLKSLSRNPGYFTRNLSGGRRGLTRVLEGNPDDNNRPTLLLITLVVLQSDWDAVLWGDVCSLLQVAVLWQWDGSPTLPPVELDVGATSMQVPRKSVPRLLALISEVERTIAAQRPVIISTADYSPDDLRALEMLIPPAARRQFTTACRSLSPQLPVTVNCMAEEAGSYNTFQFKNGSNHLSPYAQFLAEQTNLASGELPVSEIASFTQFGAASGREARAPGAPAPAALPRMMPTAPAARRVAVAPLAVTALLGLLLSGGAYMYGKSLGGSETLESQRAVQADLRRDAEAKRVSDLSDQKDQLEGKLATDLEVSRGSLDEMITAEKAKLAKAAATPPPPPPPPPPNVEEMQHLRSFVDGELARQKQRYAMIRDDVDKSLRGVDIRRIVGDGQTFVHLSGELAAFQDEWPNPSDDDKKWIAELKSAKSRIAEVSASHTQIEQLLETLNDIEDLMDHPHGAPVKDTLATLRTEIERARTLMTNIPDALPATGLKLVEWKAGIHDRIHKCADWITSQQDALKEIVESKVRHPEESTITFDQMPDLLKELADLKEAASKKQN